jgi:hypothetical protein
VTDFTAAAFGPHLYGFQQYGQGGYEANSTDESALFFRGPAKNSQSSAIFNIAYIVDLPFEATRQELTRRGWSFRDVRPEADGYHKVVNEQRYTQE